jgi:BirA family biotin operon repressor/biotin-[acetyl-CoA-carboxylase] ligase
VAPARSNNVETRSAAQVPDYPAPPPLTNRDPWATPHELAWAKAAGILLEVTSGASGLEWAILGCGVNISASPPAETTSYPTTNLAAALGTPVSRLALLQALLLRIDTWQRRLRAGERDALFAAWRARLLTIGRQVRVATPHGLIEGLAVGVDRSGGLLVRDPTGALHTITAGDVGLAP